LAAYQVEQANQNKQLFEEFQAQVEKDSKKMYDDMQQQVSQVYSLGTYSYATVKYLFICKFEFCY